MWEENKGPLVLSAVLHLVSLIGFAVYSMASPEREAEELVFELYGEESAVIPLDDSFIDPIDLESLKSEPLPPIEEYVEPVIPVEEAPVAEAVPVVEEAPPVEEPSIVEEAPAEEKPEPVSFDQFQKQFGEVTEKNKPNPNRPRETQKVNLSDRIDFSDLLNREVRTAAAAASPGDQKSVEAYFNSLILRIRNEIELHPLGGRPLLTKVSFDLVPNGTISNVRIVGSSGDAVYDRKVIAAFRRIRMFMPTPDGQAYPNLIFNIVQRG